MRRSAFTLIELLAATALAALLLAAGFRVIGSLGRARAVLARQEQSRTYVAETLDLLRWDLANARYMKSSPGELTLTGYGSLDPQTFAPRHRPVTVRYRLAAPGEAPGEADGGVGATGGGGRAWLVREQIDLDSSTNRNRSSALVCAGVAGFEVSPAAEPGAAAAAANGNASGSAAGRRSTDEGTRRNTASRPDDDRNRRPAGQPRRTPPRSRPGATAQDQTGWEGPTLGLGKPEDQEDVPPVVRVVLRPAAAGGPAADELVYAR